MKQCVINSAFGSWYPAGQERLRRSLVNVGFQGAFMANRNSVDDMAMHAKSPYAFKPRLFNSAVKSGHRLVVWCDSAVFAIRPLNRLFDHIASVGYAFFKNSCVGSFASDAALRSFGVDRDTAMTMCEITGCCMGLDLENKVAQEFLRIWTEKSLDGVTFPGAWSNERFEVSCDPRVRGHRHDQTAASIIIWKLGLETLNPKDHFFQYWECPTKEAWHEDRDNDMSQIGESVCFCNNGM